MVSLLKAYKEQSKKLGSLTSKQADKVIILIMLKRTFNYFLISMKKQQFIPENTFEQLD